MAQKGAGHNPLTCRPFRGHGAAHHFHLEIRESYERTLEESSDGFTPAIHLVQSDIAVGSILGEKAQKQRGIPRTPCLRPLPHHVVTAVRRGCLRLTHQTSSADAGQTSTSRGRGAIGLPAVSQFTITNWDSMSTMTNNLNYGLWNRRAAPMMLRSRTR